MAVNKPKPLMARQPSATKPKPKNYVPMSQTAPYSGNKPKPMGSGGSKPKPQGYRANTNPPMGAKEKTKTRTHLRLRITSTPFLMPIR